MPIYTAPNMNFIDSYVNAAKYRDERRDKSNQQMMEGVVNLVKGGADAYKWQERKNILNKADELDKREKEILAEIEKLKAERDTEAKDNMSAIMAGTGWKGTPYPYAPKADEFVAPKVGVGIFKKELL